MIKKTTRWIMICYIGVLASPLLAQNNECVPVWRRVWYYSPYGDISATAQPYYRVGQQISITADSYWYDGMTCLTDVQGCIATNRDYHTVAPSPVEWWRSRYGNEPITVNSGMGLTATFTATNPCQFKISFFSSNYVAYPFSSYDCIDSVEPTAFKLRLLSPSGDPATNTPSDPNRVAYSPARPGVLTIGLRALVEPVSVTPYIADRVVFDIDDIPGSTKTWAADNPGGRPTVDGDYLTATVYFTGLPTSNSGFGKKNARVKFDGVVDDTKCFWVFYPADAKNYAGAPPQDPDYPFIPPPNYFHYYMQTSAGVQSPCCSSPTCGAFSQTLFFPSQVPPFPYIVECANMRSIGKVIRVPGVNAGQRLYYIDLFAWCCRHEKRHHDIWHPWWAPLPPSLPPYQYPNDDFDGDRIPDIEEYLLDYGPYDSAIYDTYVYDELASDCERYTCVTAELWTEDQKEDAKGEDWAHPGSQWP